MKKSQRKKTPAASNGAKPTAARKRKARVVWPEHTHYDPKGAEKFVALLHYLRRQSALAALEEDKD